MDLRDRVTEEFEKRKTGLLVFAVLVGFGFFINQGVELKGLYMDDLYLWSCYGEQSFTEFVFPMGSSRFRFLFYLASYLELMLIGSHVTWMVPFNIILNACIAFSIYKIALHFNRNHIFSTAAGIAYLLSRMAYYQIGQFYGLMESLGLWAAVGMFYFLYRYVNERNTGAFLWANLLYFSASFIHERYMVLFPVLLLALLLGSGKKGLYEEGLREDGVYTRSRRRREPEKACTAKWILLIVTLGVFGLIQLIRFITIGTLSPAGTGGTDVADTFEMADAMTHAWEQVGFVFGVGSGPDYLCGMTYGKSPENIRNLIMAANVVLGLTVLVFVICWIRDRENWGTHLKNVVLFLAFIALCIGSSSVTIRVEMRWVYVVYAMALLFLSYMAGSVGKAGILVILYLVLMFPVETFYRGNWETIYLWPTQMRYNSLAEETVLKYGKEIFDKDVYIIGNTYEMSDFTAETFFKVYDKERKAGGLKVQFIDSDFDFKEIPEDAVILREDVEHNAYQDVTDFVKSQRFNRAVGSYEDGWIEEHAKIVFLTGKQGKVTLKCYYPGTITGNQVCRIKMNGKQLPDLVFTENSMTYELPSAPYQVISLEFSCNFYVANAKEKRGEERLAMIVDFNMK